MAKEDQESPKTQGADTLPYREIALEFSQSPLLAQDLCHRQLFVGRHGSPSTLSISKCQSAVVPALDPHLLPHRRQGFSWRALRA